MVKERCISCSPPLSLSMLSKARQNTLPNVCTNQTHPTQGRFIHKSTQNHRLYGTVKKERLVIHSMGDTK